MFLRQWRREEAGLAADVVAGRLQTLSQIHSRLSLLLVRVVVVAQPNRQRLLLQLRRHQGEKLQRGAQTCGTLAPISEGDMEEERAELEDEAAIH